MINVRVGFALAVLTGLTASTQAAITLSNDGAVANGSTVTYVGSPTITSQTAPNSAEGVGNGAVAGGTMAVVGSGSTFTITAAMGTVKVTNFELGLSAITNGQAYQLNLYALTSDPSTFPVATTGANLLGQSLTAIPSSGSGGVLYGFALSGTDSPTLAPGAYVLGISTTGTSGFIFRGPDGAYAGGTAVINGLQASSGANRDAVFSLTTAAAAATPEPASISLLGLGGLMALRRKRA